jgi:hypothetical protein
VSVEEAAMKYKLHIAFCIGTAVFGSIGCSATPPLVSYPPDERLPAQVENQSGTAETDLLFRKKAAGEVSPSEEDYGRAMMKPYRDTVSEDPHFGQPFGGREALETEHSEESRGMIGVMADMIAFPFRAVGWLIQSIF